MTIDEIDGQLMLAEVAAMDQAAAEQKHADFVEKFKPKLTTDDCYTPALVYAAVAKWVADEYHLNPETFTRPFWPGADYQAAEYPDGCTVVDNPPFSIITQCVKWYMAHGVRFFLFAPALTLFSGKREGVTYIPTGADITYENGAVVKTSFVTNLDTWLVRTAPALKKAVEAASDEEQKANKVHVHKYIYPDEVITAAFVQRLCHYGIEYRLSAEDATFIRALDAQREQGKAIFGSGFLLSERAAAERAAAERAAAERAAAERAAAIRWPLSDRERQIVKQLGGATQ